MCIFVTCALHCYTCIIAMYVYRCYTCATLLHLCIIVTPIHHECHCYTCASLIHPCIIVTLVCHCYTHVSLLHPCIIVTDLASIHCYQFQLNYNSCITYITASLQNKYLHLILTISISGNNQQFTVHKAPPMAKLLFKQHGKACWLLRLWLQKIPAQRLASQLLPFVVLPLKGPGFRSLQPDQVYMFT